MAVQSSFISFTIWYHKQIFSRLLQHSFNVFNCETASEMLKTHSVSTNYERVWVLSLAVGKKCIESRVGIQLEEQESLLDKRVVISMDGRRTRIREEKVALNKSGTHHL
jgi:hypothetical protein